MKNALLVFAFFLALASLAFADGRGTQIVGRWTEANGQDQIEFKADGTYTGIMIAGHAQTLRAVTGTYFTSGDSVGFTVGNMGNASMLWKVKITPGDLVVTFQDGGPVKFNGTTAKFQRATSAQR